MEKDASISAIFVNEVDVGSAHEKHSRCINKSACAMAWWARKSWKRKPLNDVVIQHSAHPAPRVYYFAYYFGHSVAQQFPFPLHKWSVKRPSAHLLCRLFSGRKIVFKGSGRKQVARLHFFQSKVVLIPTLVTIFSRKRWWPRPGFQFSIRTWDAAALDYAVTTRRSVNQQKFQMDLANRTNFGFQVDCFEGISHVRYQNAVCPVMLLWRFSCSFSNLNSTRGEVADFPTRTVRNSQCLIRT